MTQELFVQLIPVFLTAALAAFGYLLNFYFSKIHKDIEELKISLGRNEGRFEPLQAIMRENTIELIKLRTEVSAVWRFIDGANQRSTDGDDNGFSTR